MKQNMTPSFFIIGERKCGTSSLFRYLTSHPNICPGKLKEPNFFVHDKAYIKANWNNYLENFPKLGDRSIQLDWPELNHEGVLFEEQVDFTVDQDMITGEASANTLVDVAPEKLDYFLPHCKLIVILREPVARTYSHYRMYDRFVKEGRTINFPLLPFEQQMNSEIEAIKNGRKSPILWPSLYSKTLLPWMKYYSNRRIKLIWSQDLKKNPQKILSSICSYLGIDDYNWKSFEYYNQAPKEEIPASAKSMLLDFFKEYNDQLFEYLCLENKWQQN